MGATGWAQILRRGLRMTILGERIEETSRWGIRMTTPPWDRKDSIGEDCLDDMPGAKCFGDRPGLGDASAWSMRGLFVKDFCEGAHWAGSFSGFFQERRLSG